jgi:hypothetical protein
VALAVLTGCQGLPAGPTLANVTVSPLALQPTAGDPALCCCRVVGTTKNDNSVPVHATFKFSAFDGEHATPISRILFFVADFRPGAERPIDAHGFLYPCVVIKELKTELDVRGITLPPL